MRKKSGQAGFTLIEVMLVVMIIGVLSAIMLPNVKNYSDRSRVSEVLLAFDTCKNMVNESYSSADTLPADGDWGCEAGVGTGSPPSTSPVSQYVEVVETKQDIVGSNIPGTIRITIQGFAPGSSINGSYLTLAPVDSAGNAPVAGASIRNWRCGSPLDGTDLPQRYRPGSCNGT